MDLVVTKEQEPELLAIQAKAKVDDDRFQGGLKFAHLVIDGSKVNAAYAEAFNVDAEVAKKVSSQFHRSKWVQNLVLFLTPDDGTINQAECRVVIRKLMAIVNSERTTPREKTEAAKALQPYIKQEKQRAETELNLTIGELNVGETASTNLSKQIALLHDAGKMVNSNGEVIDVDVIY